MLSAIANLFRSSSNQQTDNTLRNIPLSHSVDYTGMTFTYQGVQFTLCRYAVIAKNVNTKLIKVVWYSELSHNERNEWLDFVEDMRLQAIEEQQKQDELNQVRANFKRVQQRYETTRMRLDPHYTF